MAKAKSKKKPKRVVKEKNKLDVLNKFCEPILQKYSKSIKAIWMLHHEESSKSREIDLIFLLNDTHSEFNSDKKLIEHFILKEKKEIQRKYKIMIHEDFYEITAYFEDVMSGKPEIFSEIKHSIAIYDPSSFFSPFKDLIKRGKILGTKESLMNLIFKIKDRFKTINHLKMQVFENIYISTIDAGQAALIASDHSIPIQRELSSDLEKYFVKKGLLEEKYIKYCSEIIHLFKENEHGKLGNINGELLDELIGKNHLFVDRMGDLIEEIELKKKDLPSFPEE